MKLSVIIPLYNAEEFVAEALDSLQSQVGVDLEIIVVDDESKDNSAAIVQKYPVQYYKKTNGGASSARNYGLERATGDYVMFLDADDYLKDKNICKECIERAESENLDFVMFTYQYFNTTTKEYGVSVNYPQVLEGLSDVVELTEAMVRCGIYPASPCFKVLKRSFMMDNKLSFIEGTTSEDVEWFTRLLLCTRRYAVINNDAYIYRKGVASSVTGSFTEKKCWNFINIMHKSCELVEHCSDSRLKNTLCSALCYDYFILLGDSAKFIGDKKIYKELKSLWYLNKYNQFQRTKLLSMAGKLVGVKLLSKMLGYMIEHYSKSSK